MTTHPVRFAYGGALLTALIGLAPMVRAATQTAPESFSHDPREYSVTYNEHSSSQSFNVEVVRGMTMNGNDSKMYSINSYASSLLMYDRSNPAYYQSSPAASDSIIPNAVWPTVKDPVAVAFYGGSVYVLGQGTHALAKHDALSGRIISVFTPAAAGDAQPQFSEPADLVIDNNGHAFVSCMGSDAVYRIDLTGPTMVELNRWTTGLGTRPGEVTNHGATPHESLGLKRPRFLSLHGGKVYVAPFLSGNNTVSFMEGGSSSGSGFAGTDIVDGYDHTNGLSGEGFPDADLVCIDPNAAANAQVTRVFRRAGNLLTAHGFVPGSTNVWMLGIDSLNRSAFTEPNLKGNFAKHTAAIAALPSTGTTATLDPMSDIVDLELNGTATAYSTDNALPFPYALEFGLPNGLVAVASSTLSRISLRDATGNHVAFIPPAPGSVGDWEVVRDLMYVQQTGTATGEPTSGSGQSTSGGEPTTPAEQQLFIYCQQSSEIVVWDVLGGTPATAEAYRFSLLGDPTPADIAKGRSTFYDARLSENHRSTCATCHPGGESDLTIWSLKDGIRDYKDQMVTQPLKGLRETFPFHWRGERNMDDFNGAFEGLLGSTRPLGTRGDPHGNAAEFSEFESFLFSLRPAANPRATLNRMLPERLEFIGMDSDTNGKPLHFDVVPAAAHVKYAAENCNDCHMLPTGSIGSIQNDNNQTEVAHAALGLHIETIQFSNFLQARDQSVLEVGSLGGPTLKRITRPYLGAGTMHSGGRPSFQQFILNKFHQTFAGMNATEAQKLLKTAEATAFIMSLDTGTSPAAHHVIVMNRVDTAATQTRIQDILLDQANKGWIDVVVHAATPISSTTYDDRSWHYIPGTGSFRQDDGTSLVNLSYFATIGGVDRQYVFFGALPGTGKRLGGDFDRDGLINGAENSIDGWLTDRDGDTYPDGHEATPLTGGGMQGDPNDPAVTSAAETTLPSLASGSFFTPLMYRASHAQFTFEADEDVRWTLIGVPTGSAMGSGNVFASGRGYARSHTAHLHGLREESTYSVTLYMFDHAGNLKRVGLTDEVGSPIQLTTLVNRGGAVPKVEPIVSELTAQGMPAGSSFTATYDLKVVDADDTARPGLEDRYVLVQMVRAPSGTEDWERIANDDIVAPTAANWDSGPGKLTTLPDIDDGSAYPVMPLGYDSAGPDPNRNFILLPLTSSGVDLGKVSIDVTITNANTDRIGFVVVDILEESKNGGDPAALEFDFSKIGDWVMPRTKTQHRAIYLRQ